VIILHQYRATSVGVVADLEHGEGWIVFQWPHDRYGYDALHIDLDGHCSRRMRILSGEGPPEFTELHRDRIQIRFNPQLAKKLQLEGEIEISFRLSDEEFEELRRVVEYLNGEEFGPIA
jgi:hypothetical protein